MPSAARGTATVGCAKNRVRRAPDARGAARERPEPRERPPPPRPPRCVLPVDGTLLQVHVEDKGTPVARLQFFCPLCPYVHRPRRKRKVDVPTRKGRGHIIATTTARTARACGARPASRRGVLSSRYRSGRTSPHDLRPSAMPWPVVQASSPHSQLGRFAAAGRARTQRPPLKGHASLLGQEIRYFRAHLNSLVPPPLVKAPLYADNFCRVGIAVISGRGFIWDSTASERPVKHERQTPEPG